MTTKVNKFRCMTCDKVTKGQPVFLPVSDKKGCDTVGLCTKCATVIRSFHTLAALYRGDYHLADERQEDREREKAANRAFGRGQQ